MHFNVIILNSENKIKTAWNIIEKGNKKQTEINLGMNTHFNQYFNTVTDSSADDCVPNVTVFPVTGYQHSFNFFSVTGAEVSAAIGKTKYFRSSGFDEIPSDFLKYYTEELSFPSTFIINNSFSSGKFPGLLKIALHKKGSTDKVESYRPISLISTFAKVIEKIVTNRLLNCFK